MDLHLEQRLPEVTPDDLRSAWADIMRRARLNSRHRVTHEELSVRDHMSRILRRLGGVRFMEFTELFMERVTEGDPAAIVVVHFLALLELARESLLEITQAGPYAPIYIRLAYTRASA
jgi:segregation and condensation protein A